MGGFNRTIIELKYNHFSLPATDSEGFNRTIIELKSSQNRQLSR